MATRNPTAFTKWIEHHRLRPGKLVLTNELDQIFDDQEFTLDAPALLISAFPLLETTSTSYQTCGIYKIDAKDMCDVAAGGGGYSLANNLFQCTFYVQVTMPNAGSSLATVRVTTGAASGNQTTTSFSPGSSPDTAWVTGTVNVQTNDNEDTVTLEVKAEAAASGDEVFVSAFSLYAPTT